MKKKVGNQIPVGSSLSAFLIDEIRLEGDWFPVSNSLDKMGNISKNSTHVLSSLGKSSSAQTLKTAHVQHAPLC